MVAEFFEVGAVSLFPFLRGRVSDADVKQTNDMYFFVFGNASRLVQEA